MHWIYWIWPNLYKHYKHQLRNHAAFAEAHSSRWHRKFADHPEANHSEGIIFDSQSHALSATFPACNNGYVFNLALVYFLFHRFMFCFVCFIFNSKVTEKKIGCAILLENSRHLKGLVQEKKKSIRVRKKLLCRTGTKRESTRVGHGHAWSRLAIRAANPPILQAQKWLTAHTFRTNFSS